MTDQERNNTKNEAMEPWDRPPYQDPKCHRCGGQEGPEDTFTLTPREWLCRNCVEDLSDTLISDQDLYHPLFLYVTKAIDREKNRDRFRGPADENEPLKVARKAAVIANYMTSRTSSKKHGGYNHYEDGRLHISLDTFVPNITIRLHTKNGTITVYSAGYTNHARPDQFRPGRWISYMDQIFMTAVDNKYRKDRQKMQRDMESTRARYRPVDDAALFSS